MKKIVLLLSSVIVAAAAFAADSFDERFADIRLLQRPDVKKELGITDAQRAKMNKHASAYNEASQRLLKAAGNKQPDMKQLRQEEDRLRTSVIKELTGPQVKRLRELSLQSVGVLAMLDEVLAAKCGVSNAQLGKMRAVMQQAGKSAGDYRQSFLQKHVPEVAKLKGAERDKKEKQYDQEMGRTLSKYFDDARRKIEAMITADQRAKFTALEGKHFTPAKG